jgi:hypothetical protein
LNTEGQSSQASASRTPTRSGGARAGRGAGISVGTPRCRRIRPITAASSMSAIKRKAAATPGTRQHVKPECAFHQRRPTLAAGLAPRHLRGGSFTSLLGGRPLRFGRSDGVMIFDPGVRQWPHEPRAASPTTKLHGSIRYEARLDWTFRRQVLGVRIRQRLSSRVRSTRAFLFRLLVDLNAASARTKDSPAEHITDRTHKTPSNPGDW